MILRNTILVVDLDYTLVNTNTTFEFLRLLCPLKYLMCSILLKPVLLFLNFVFKKDFYKLLLVLMCIKGLRRSKLKLYGELYCEKILKRNAHKYFYKYRSIQATIRRYKVPKVLLTASLDFIAENFKKYGFDIVVASKSYYRKDRFYRFVDIYGRKSEIVKVLLKYFDRVIVIDDDPEPGFYTLDKRVLVIRVPK